jgi:hypothetical protein
LCDFVLPYSIQSSLTIDQFKHRDKTKGKEQ